MGAFCAGVLALGAFAATAALSAEGGFARAATPGSTQAAATLPTPTVLDPAALALSSQTLWAALPSTPTPSVPPPSAGAPAAPLPAAPTFAAIGPQLSPDRLGAEAALSFTISFSGGPTGVPMPLRRSVIHFPAGMTLEIPSLRSCSKAHLLAHGVKGCPPQSKLGTGHALAEVRAGSLLLSEEAQLWVLLGPLSGGNPTLEVLAQGYTPLDERLVLTGTVLPDKAPYGEQMVIPIPLIPTLRYEPDASIVNFTLRIGASPHHHTRESSSVLVPPSCSAPGFPFAAEFTYADGSTGSALASVPCP